MMPIRWPNYSLFVFAAIFGLVFPMLLSAIWGWIRALARSGPTQPELSAEDSGRTVGESEPIAIRFHLAALLFIGFLGMALLLVPLLFAIRTAERNEATLSIFAIALPLLIAVFHSIRKGDLSWGSGRARADHWRGE